MSDVLDLARPRHHLGDQEHARRGRDEDLVALMVTEGVPLAALTAPPIPQIRHVIIGDRFKDCSIGEKALIFEAGDDEIAWNPVDNCWASGRGIAWALGQDCLQEEGLGISRPIPVYKTPLEWLRRSRRGLVILNWDHAARVLGGLCLVVSTRAFAEMLDRQLRVPESIIHIRSDMTRINK